MEGSLPTDQLQVAAAPAPLDLSEIEPSRKRSLPPTTEGPPKRSKKGKKSKGGSKAVIPELNPSDYVRVVKVTNKDDLLHEGPVLLSKSDKASQMHLSDNRMSVTSSKGYRMARATHGAFQGTWYFEVKITKLGKSGHVRLGWSTRKGDLQAPVGYDQHSFGYRDLEGVKGDIIGCLLHMPEGGRAFEKEKSDIVTWKGELYFVDEPTADPAKLEGSLVAFTKNGRMQGIAYRDINEGTYSPAASIYTLPEQKDGATVTFNFGPDFEHTLPELQGCPPARPVAELSGPPDDIAFPAPAGADTEPGLEGIKPSAVTT
ncbi:MAG: Set1 Ash2 histone methyltransferase complex subunit ASH2 [Trebouxia sp. A1-2]|nr:MAG: Set1 Ash2 histone methyltransferase complex subunit ASH2 [Trebouxia sp. A1-2]